MPRGESDVSRSVVTLVAVKCAVVSPRLSRWACRKRRRRNSPCIREDVLVMAGMKVMLPLLAYCSRYVFIFLRAATCSGASRSWGWVSGTRLPGRCTELSSRELRGLDL